MGYFPGPPYLPVSLRLGHQQSVGSSGRAERVMWACRLFPQSRRSRSTSSEGQESLEPGPTVPFLIRGGRGPTSWRPGPTNRHRSLADTISFSGSPKSISGTWFSIHFRRGDFVFYLYGEKRAHRRNEHTFVNRAVMVVMAPFIGFSNSMTKRASHGKPKRSCFECFSS